MPRLFDTIRSLVLQDRYIIGEHAIERLDERGVLEWQVVDGIERGELIFERPEARPNPAVEVHQVLADGTPIKAVWSHLIAVDFAKLDTIHYLDEHAI